MKLYEGLQHEASKRLLTEISSFPVFSHLSKLDPTAFGVLADLFDVIESPKGSQLCAEGNTDPAVRPCPVERPWHHTRPR